MCVDYDHDFVQDLASQFQAWVSAPGKKTNPKAKKVLRGKRSTAKRMSDSSSDSEDHVVDAKSTGRRPARRQVTKALKEYTDEDASDSD